MKKLVLGIGTAVVLLTAAPAMAQVGFYVGPGGFGVGVGPDPYYDGPYGYYSYEDHGPYWHRHYYHDRDWR